MRDKQESIIKKKPSSLTEKISADDFRMFYWCVKELNDFCQEHNLSTTGDKAEKCQRIEQYLQTGCRQKAKSIRQLGPKDSVRGPIQRETLVVNYVNDAATRSFLQSQLGSQFKFTVSFHNMRRQLMSTGAKLTYGELADTYKQIQKNSRVPTQGLSKACEFNRFLNDFAKYETKRSAGDAKAAWNKLIKFSGPHNYSHYKLHIEKI